MLSHLSTRNSGAFVMPFFRHWRYSRASSHSNCRQFFESGSMERCFCSNLFGQIKSALMIIYHLSSRVFWKVGDVFAAHKVQVRKPVTSLADSELQTLNSCWSRRYCNFAGLCNAPESQASKLESSNKSEVKHMFIIKHSSTVLLSSFIDIVHKCWVLGRQPILPSTAITDWRRSLFLEPNCQWTLNVKIQKTRPNMSTWRGVHIYVQHV